MKKRPTLLTSAALTLFSCNLFATQLADHYFASEVVNYAVYGDNNGNTDPNATLGAPDGSFLSLGGGGWVELKLAKPLTDYPGVDLQIEEVGNGELYGVYISETGEPNSFVHVADLDHSGTLDISNLVSHEGQVFNFIYIKDKSNAQPGTTYPGADIDAVIVLSPLED